MGQDIEPHRTLKKSVVLCGHGLHSGLKTGIILSPLPPGSGIVFWDISSGGRVSAKLQNVRSTEYATTLSNGEVVIKTVEHIMSALHSYKITNLLVKIGDEAPIMDGSCSRFLPDYRRWRCGGTKRLYRADCYRKTNNRGRPESRQIHHSRTC